MSDGAAATLLAGIIAAFVAAGVFLAGEIIKVVRSVHDRRAASIQEVLGALDRLMRDATKPKVSLIWSNTPLQFMSAAMRLFPVLPKRDMIVVDWLLDHSQRLTVARSRVDIGDFVAQAQGYLMLWMRYPKIGRRAMEKDLRSREVESPIADLMKVKPGR